LFNIKRGKYKYSFTMFERVTCPLTQANLKQYVI
jgi:hypothetical protein